MKLLSTAGILGAALRSIDDDGCNVNLDMIFFCVDTTLSDCVSLALFSSHREAQNPDDLVFFWASQQEVNKQRRRMTQQDIPQIDPATKKCLLLIILLVGDGSIFAPFLSKIAVPKMNRIQKASLKEFCSDENKMIMFATAALPY